MYRLAIKNINKITNTNIFITIENGIQYNIYRNTISNNENNNLMLIPVPNIRSVEIIDINYNTLYNDCKKCFKYDNQLSTRYSKVDFVNAVNSLYDGSAGSYKFGNYETSIIMNIDELKIARNYELKDYNIKMFI